MLLGDLVKKFDDESIVTETLLVLDDLSLIARLTQETESQGCTVGEFAALAVRQYAENAPNEEWITLMGSMSRSADPGSVFLKRALAFALARANRPMEQACGHDHSAPS